MWIHHSCGNLMKTVMATASDDDGERRQPCRVPAGAYRFVGDEEVLERVREDQQQPSPLEELEQRDPDEAVQVEEPMTSNAVGSRQFRIDEMYAIAR